MNPDTGTQIENHFHFIWFGPALPDFAYIAIRSALAENPESTATLWHDSSFKRQKFEDNLVSAGLTYRLIDEAELFDEVAQLDTLLDVEQLQKIYRQLTAPAARANVIRMLALFLYGGIYLDTDTLTLKDLSPLRRREAFCGKEMLLWPIGRAKLDPRSLSLAALRSLSSLLPYGYRPHRLIERFYARAENNAVLAARKQHPLLWGMLKRMTLLTPEQWTRRFRLGTHLLQQTLRDFEKEQLLGKYDIEIHAPSAFYPVGPALSLHYFRQYDDPSKVSAELLEQSTSVIHWYASVKSLSTLDFEYIKTHDKKSVYALLCRRYLPLKSLN